MCIQLTHDRLGVSFAYWGMLKWSWSLQVVVGAAVCGAVYAGLAYFKKDQDVGESFNKFGNNVQNDARGTSSSHC